MAALANMTICVLGGAGDEHKISSGHRERAALTYLRQSSMAQVGEHAAICSIVQGSPIRSGCR